jgi:general secretion pathway protein H
MRILEAGSSNRAPTFAHFVWLSAPRGGWLCLGRPGAVAGLPCSQLRMALCPPRGLALLGAARRCGRLPFTDRPEVSKGLPNHAALVRGGGSWRLFSPLARRYRRVSLSGTPSASAASFPYPLGKGSLHPSPNPRQRGFTLLELLVVMMIIAFASAGVALAMRDGTQTQLEREGERLAVLFESARAQSRANGNTVIWRVVEGGFRFEGLPPDALPNQWLSPDTVAAPNAAIQLGPEPIIGAQSVELASLSQPERSLRIVTDGLQPFAVVQTAATTQ